MARTTHTAPCGKTRTSATKVYTHGVAVYDLGRPEMAPGVWTFHTTEKLAVKAARAYRPGAFRTLVVPVTTDGTRSVLWAQRIADLRNGPAAPAADTAEARPARRPRVRADRWDIVGKKSNRLVVTVDAPTKGKAEGAAMKLQVVRDFAVRETELWVAVPHDPDRQQAEQSAPHAEPAPAAAHPAAQAALAYGPGAYPLSEQHPAPAAAPGVPAAMLADTPPPAPVDVDAIASAMARVPASFAFFASRAEQRRRLETLEAQVLAAEGTELEELTEALAVARVVCSAMDKVVIKADPSARGGIGFEERLLRMRALVAAPWATTLQYDDLRYGPREEFAAAGLHDPRRKVWNGAARTVVGLLNG